MVARDDNSVSRLKLIGKLCKRSFAKLGTLLHTAGALIALNPGVPAVRRTARAQGKAIWMVFYAAILAGMVLLF